MTPTTIPMTAFRAAQRYVGTKEAAGVANNPLIVAMLRLDQSWPEGDAVAWCSAFLNFIAWGLELPRSKQLNARSWLGIGVPVQLQDAAAGGNDIVILKRGTGKQPGPEVQNAPGHVGIFAGWDPSKPKTFWLLGGNQGDSVSIASFPVADILGIRRLA